MNGDESICAPATDRHRTFAGIWGRPSWSPLRARHIVKKGAVALASRRKAEGVSMETERGKVLRCAIFRASCNTATLAVPAGTAATALLLNSGMLGALSLFGYVVAVVATLMRPEGWREAIKEVRHRPPRLPLSSDFTDLGPRDFCNRLQRARSERDAALEAMPGSVQPLADSIVQGAIGLEEKAIGMLPVLDRIRRQLGSDPLPPVRAELGRLEEAAAGDPAVRTEYRRALALIRERLRLLEEAERLDRLLTARLDSITCALEALAPTLTALELQRAAARVLDDEPTAGALMSELRLLQEAAAGTEETGTEGRT